MDNDRIASLLVNAVSMRNRKYILKLDNDRLRDAVLQLAHYGVLSAKNIGAILDLSAYRVKNFVSLTYFGFPDSRGSLNPAHLEAIAYLLSLKGQGLINREWVNRIINDGTSVSVLSELTGISQATIYRIKEGK